MKNTYDVIIIGGGIVGFATGLKLLQQHPNLTVAILEKEDKCAKHQTGHNSGVIHAGVYYKPGSLKAKLCRAGSQAAKEFCQVHNIPFAVPGKLIAATSTQELEWMEAIEARCRANGLTVERLSQAEIEKREPGLTSCGGLFVAESGIVNWRVVCEKYQELFMALGGEVFYQQTVIGIDEGSTSVTVTTASQEFECGNLITAAGLYADKIAALSGLELNFKIVPFRGEYYQLDQSKCKGRFNHLIYPVPNPALPFLGVHFTKQIDGRVTIGPNAVLALAREGYSWKKINIKDCFEIVTYSAFWKMLSRHLKATFNELHGSLSKSQYLKLIRQYYLDIAKSDLRAYPAGVRAQAISHDGTLIDDFLFEKTHRILHTCNAPSPAATSSLPIAEHIVSKFDRLIAR